METPDQLLRSGYLVTILVTIITLRMAEISQCKSKIHLLPREGLGMTLTKQQ